MFTEKETEAHGGDSHVLRVKEAAELGLNPASQPLVLAAKPPCYNPQCNLLHCTSQC